MLTHPSYPIDEGLGIIPGKLHNHLNLIAVREYFRDQRGALIRGKSMADQLFPGGVFATCEKAVNQRTDDCWYG